MSVIFALLPEISFSNEELNFLSDHSFQMRVLTSKKRVQDSQGEYYVETKKVFVSYVQGPYVFKKKREKGNRVTFTCNGCQKVNRYLSVFAVREKIDGNPENDRYFVDEVTISDIGDHACGNSGINDIVRQFKSDLIEQVRANPTQPMPALYTSIRYNSFLSQLNHVS